MTTIKLSKYGDDLQVSPSNVAPGSVAFCAYGEKIERVPAVATPAELDAFVAAGDRALGRRSTPLETRLLAEADAADERVEEGWSLGVEDADLAAARGRAEGLRTALAMVREAGPTVPRAAVAAIMDSLAQVSAMLDASDDKQARKDAVRAIDRVLVQLGQMTTGTATEKT